MNHILTADDLYTEMKRMPTTERVRFFSLLTSNAFREDDFTHEQVFGEIHQEPFSAREAAEYLEVSLPTLRRCVQSGKLAPSHIVGRNQMFSAQSLRVFKRNRRGQGPQDITLHGRSVAVALSRAAFERLSGSGHSLGEFMRRSPLFGLEEIEFERDRSTTREGAL